MRWPETGVPHRYVPALLLSRRWALHVLMLAAACAGAGLLGVALAPHARHAHLLAPDAGIALAALLLFGRGLWPGVWLGTTTAAMLAGAAWPFALALGTGAALQAWLGARLLDRLVGFQRGFDRIRDVVGFLLFGVLATPAIEATAGALGHLLGLAGDGARALPGLWLTWWLSGVGGVLVFAPVPLLWRRPAAATRQTRRRTEIVALAVALAASAGLAFGGLGGEAASRLPLAFLVFPAVLWGALRFGARGAAAASCAVSLVAVWGTARGRGAFALESGDLGVALLWLFLIVLGGTAMLIAAALSELRRAVRQRMRLEAQIQQAQKFESLGALAGGIAHDFNNLLHSVIGNAELIAELSREGTPERRYAFDIARAADRASDLCRQLLRYAGHAPFATTPLDLNELVGEVSGLVESAVSKKVRIQYVLPRRLPPVHGDPGQLRQVLVDLVQNAARSIGNRSGEITIRLGVRRLAESYLAELPLGEDLPGGRYVAVEVSDTGRGRTHATWQRLFDPVAEGGHGLGLAAAVGIVRAHGGALEVDGLGAAGTTVRIYLPAIVPTPPAPLAPPDGARRGPRGTVLVIDDEEGVRQVCRRHLERAGFEVLLAGDGEAGVARFRAHSEKIGLVLLDMRMPRLGGAEVLSRIREVRDDVPVIVMSGFGGEEIARAHARTTFLHKPYRPQELIDEVRQYLR